MDQKSIPPDGGYIIDKKPISREKEININRVIGNPSKSPPRASAFPAGFKKIKILLALKKL